MIGAAFALVMLFAMVFFFSDDQPELGWTCVLIALAFIGSMTFDLM